MTYVNLLKNDKKNKTFMDYEPGDVPKKETTTVSYTPPESYTEKEKDPFLEGFNSVSREEESERNSLLGRTSSSGRDYTLDDAVTSKPETGIKYLNNKKLFDGFSNMKNDAFLEGFNKESEDEKDWKSMLGGIKYRANDVYNGALELGNNAIKNAAGVYGGIKEELNEKMGSPDFEGRRRNAYDSRVREQYAARERTLDYSNVDMLNEELRNIRAAERGDKNSTWYNRLERAKNSGDAKTYEKVKHEMQLQKDKINYALKGRYEKYEDDFLGQLGANYRDAELEKAADRARYQYYKDPTVANEEYLKSLNATLEEFRKNNTEALADDETMPLITENFARFAPDFVENVVNNFKYPISGRLRNTVDALQDVELKLMDAHYSRNDNMKDVELPKTDKEAEAMGWDGSVAANYHQFTAPKRDNIKFVSPDGRYEIIFDSKGERIITAEEDKGTYNYYDPKTQKILHAIYDVIPWYLYGNSLEDKTTLEERIVLPLVT